MAIKNADGTPYSSYSTPNPLMSSQVIWPKDEEIIFKNKCGQRYYSDNLDRPVTVEAKEVKVLQKPIEEIKIVPTIRFQESTNGGVVEVWCLPCVGMNGPKSIFGDKFKFRAKIINQEDLFIKIVAEQRIANNSILFPQNTTKRWWKVRDSKEIKGFYVMFGEITDFEPSF